MPAWSVPMTTEVFLLYTHTVNSNLLLPTTPANSWIQDNYFLYNLYYIFSITIQSLILLSPSNHPTVVLVHDSFFLFLHPPTSCHLFSIYKSVSVLLAEQLFFTFVNIWIICGACEKCKFLGSSSSDSDSMNLKWSQRAHIFKQVATEEVQTQVILGHHFGNITLKQYTFTSSRVGAKIKKHHSCPSLLMFFFWMLIITDLSATVCCNDSWCPCGCKGI